MGTPGTRRSGRTVRRQLIWPPIRAHVRAHWRSVAVVGALAVAVAISVLLLGGNPAFVGFVAGIGVSIVLAFACWAILEGSGARAAVVGAIGEDLTADELDHLGNEWRRIDSVPFGSIFDVDHVLVSERGVYAIETKFTAQPWSASSSELQRAAGNARWKARKVKLLLAGSGQPTVSPMLVVWGHGARQLPAELIEIDGVTVSRGSSEGALREYLRSRPRVLSPESVDSIFNAINQHTDRTERAIELRRSS